MFTGLVEEVGEIVDIKRRETSQVISIKGKKVLEGINVGESICTNGVCLTVTNFTENTFSAYVMPETMKRSNLKHLKKGSKVNLERALRVGDRLGGHVVTGHIDGVGKIKGIKEDQEAVWIKVETYEELLKYIIEKGSIAIDGISLTVANVDKESFEVSIIPHTGKETTLLHKKIDEEVNLECDLVGKYVEKLMGFKKSVDKNISIDFLKENGFY